MSSEMFFKLILGAYAFTALSFGWAWLLYTRMTFYLEALVRNHIEHLQDRVTELEAGVKDK